MIVRQLLTELGFRLDQGGVNVYVTTINNIRNAAQQAQNSLGAMFGAIATLGALKSLAHVADEMQSLEFRIGELPQTVGSAADSFDLVAKHAIETRHSLGEYANLYIRIAGATTKFLTTQEEVVTVTDTVAKALVIGGATAREQASALFQLSQGFQAGKLQGNDFKIFMAAMSSDFKNKFSEAAGFSIEQLKEMSSQGKLTAELVARALLKIAPQFDESFKNVPLTVGAATAVIGSKFAWFIAKLNRESHVITNVASFFVDTFDRIEAGLNNIVDFFGDATKTVKFFGIAIAAALAPAVFRFLAGSVMFLVSPLGLLIAGLILVGLAIEDFYAWMRGGKSLFGQWFGNFDDAKRKFLEYEDTITAVKIAVVSAVALMGLHFAQLAINAGIAAARTGLVWALTFAEFAIAVATNGLVIASWVVNTLARIGILVIGWIISFAQMAIATIAATWPLLLIIVAIVAVIAAAYLLWKNWDTVMEWLTAAAAKAYDFLFSGFESAGIKIAEYAKGIWDSVAGGFSAMVEKISGYWNAFKSFFGMGVTTTITAAANAQQATNIAPSTVAGAASAASGVPSYGAGPSLAVTVNQTLPPGTTAETAAAAKDATMQAAPDSFAAFSRQMAQAY